MQIFEAMKVYEKELNASPPPPYNTFARPINFNMGLIQGGNWASSVAASCTFQARIGLYPGANLDEEKKKLEAIVTKRAGELALRTRVSWVGFQAEGFAAPQGDDGNFEKLLHELEGSFLEATGRQAVRAPLTCTTDARCFYLYYGIPATCLGPKAQRIHGVDECVEMKSVMEVASTYALFIAKWCGLSKIDESQ